MKNGTSSEGKMTSKKTGACKILFLSSSENERGDAKTTPNMKNLLTITSMTLQFKLHWRHNKKN